MRHNFPASHSFSRGQVPTFDLYMKMKNKERREMELRAGKHGAEGPAFKNMKRTLFSKVS